MDLPVRTPRRTENEEGSKELIRKSNSYLFRGKMIFIYVMVHGIRPSINQSSETSNVPKSILSSIIPKSCKQINPSCIPFVTSTSSPRDI